MIRVIKGRDFARLLASSLSFLWSIRLAFFLPVQMRVIPHALYENCL